MKVFAAVAVATTFAAASAEPNSHLHLRANANEAVTEPAEDGKVAEWGQCKWQDKQLECAGGMECIVSNDYYGQCVKKVADVREQCAGYDWIGSCKAGNTCEKKNEYYSECTPITNAPGTVGEWAQCKWEDKSAACADGLECVVHDNYYGQCIKKMADLWGQCGGYGWTGECAEGKCEKKDDYYSQCVQN